MSEILLFVKKELRRFFSDGKTIASILLPGVLMFVLYTFIGKAMATRNETSTYVIHTNALPQSMEFICDNEKIELSIIETISDKSDLGEADLVMIFSPNYEEDLKNKLQGIPGNIPSVSLYYDSSSTQSSTVYNIILEYMNAFEDSVANVVDINADPNIQYDLATEESMSKVLLASIIPMVLLTFTINSCVSIAAESIAGEKERGTIATILVTPINRKSIIIGKAIALSLIGLMSGVSVFVGLILSLPELFEGMSQGLEVNTMVYSGDDYMLLLVVIMSTILFFVSIISVISGFSKSTREASMMATPLTVLGVLVSLRTFLGINVSGEFYWYLIPVYNSVECMNGILGFTPNVSNIAITVVVNIIWSFIFVVVLTKMIDREKIIFNV